MEILAGEVRQLKRRFTATLRFWNQSNNGNNNNDDDKRDNMHGQGNDDWLSSFEADISTTAANRSILASAPTLSSQSYHHSNNSGSNAGIGMRAPLMAAATAPTPLLTKRDSPSSTTTFRASTASSSMLDGHSVSQLSSSRRNRLPAPPAAPSMLPISTTTNTADRDASFRTFTNAPLSDNAPPISSSLSSGPGVRSKNKMGGVDDGHNGRAEDDFVTSILNRR
jgi:hypothetical protein